MPELMYPNIYCNRIPLPKNPLKSLNSYIITSHDRNLIIDTGFNQPECEKAFFDGIAEIGIDLTKTDLLLTHRHSDHTGLAGILDQKGVRIYAGAKETVEILNATRHDFNSSMSEKVTMFGLDEYGVTADDHPGVRYRSKPINQCNPLSEGAQLKYGDYTFSIVDIPGHTPGQIGLYEAKHRLFFCGDHILASITPNITFWNFEQDSLAQYLSSLRKVGDMDIDWLFTAHREIIRDHKTRIDQLIGHHTKRLAEIVQILSDGSRKNASQVAALMHWEIRAKNWQEFPKAQKFFASGEAAAHLEYLFNTGQLNRTTQKGTNYYKLKDF